MTPPTIDQMHALQQVQANPGEHQEDVSGVVLESCVVNQWVKKDDFLGFTLTELGRRVWEGRG